VTSVFIGVEDLSPLDLFDLSKQEASTLFASRLPRLISIVIAGLSMSICGLIMQQISRNKFVSPTTAGTMDWARLGILISLLLFTSASPLIKML
ncbi:petrobactin ABC transporter permease YclN, partial [Xanthomonas citri pv. citri]|nr:petrobactin ABC transporter permease YclN [Xanthomonas citri pv. citri]